MKGSIEYFKERERERWQAAFSVLHTEQRENIGQRERTGRLEH
jgi:hypothetical protein